MNDTYSVYVQTDTNNNIIAPPNSSAFLTDTTGWIKIDEGVGDKYHHAQGNYFPLPYASDTGVFRYRLVNGAAVAKTDDEITAEETTIVPTPTTEEQLRADVDYLAVMTGVSL